MDKIVFIIAHKYFRGYPSYLKYYIDNILAFYDNALIIVVDNNSPNKEDIFRTISYNPKIIFLDNDIKCKFELGAYQVAIKYIIDNNLIEKYDYYVCTQDTYILKNKFNFGELKDVKAASIIGWRNDLAKMDVVATVLDELGLFNNLESTNLCWCNSFVVSNEKLTKLYGYLTKIIIERRHESEASERYLGRILSELNDGINYTIDGSDNSYLIDGVRYDCHNVNPYVNIDKHFCKIAQQKNEGTIEK